ncbi:hypothetical protein NL676_034254 [Syzygium grande]|nr:hypothetical protein NL676_034254 [Syzygium grande]
MDGGCTTPKLREGFFSSRGSNRISSRCRSFLPPFPFTWLSRGIPGSYGDKHNGVEMAACHLATHYSLNERLTLIEERLGRLTTDDPSVIETSLSQYGDLVYPDRRSTIHK